MEVYSHMKFSSYYKNIPLEPIIRGDRFPYSYEKLWSKTVVDRCSWSWEKGHILSRQIDWALFHGECDSYELDG